jgi:hypothetical protein
MNSKEHKEQSGIKHDCVLAGRATHSQRNMRVHYGIMLASFPWCSLLSTISFALVENMIEIMSQFEISTSVGKTCLAGKHPSFYHILPIGPFIMNDSPLHQPLR